MDRRLQFFSRGEQNLSGGGAYPCYLLNKTQKDNLYKKQSKKILFFGQPKASPYGQTPMYMSHVYDSGNRAIFGNSKALHQC